MKKALFVIAVLFLRSLISHAQTEKGNQTLGLNLGWHFNTNDNTYINPFDNSITDQSSQSRSFNIGPGYSYFIADKLDLGAALSFGRSTYHYLNHSPGGSNLQDQTSYSYGGIIYLRKYFMFADKIGLRGGPYAGYTKGDSKNIYSGADSPYNIDSKTDNYNAGVKLDMVYYPSKKLGVSASLASLSYTHYKTDSGTQGHSDGENVDLAFVSNSLVLSVFYALGSK